MEQFSSVSVLLALAGCVLLVIAVRRLRRERSFRNRSRRATGVVVEQRLQAAGGSESGSSYFPVVRFSTTDGRIITFISDMGSMPAHPAPGTGVGVLYDPDQPADARIDSFLRTKGRATVELFLGACLLGASLVLVVARWATARLPVP